MQVKYFLNDKTKDKCLLKCFFYSCNSTQFWNGASCETLRLYNKTCASTSQCWFYGGLICQNGICDCPLPIQQKM